MSCHYVDITNTSASIFNVETTSVHDVVSTSFQRNLPAGKEEPVENKEEYLVNLLRRRR